MAAKDPATVANLWSTRLQASQTEMVAGVNAVTEAPGAKAAAKADQWLAKLQASRPKWIRNTGGVTLQSWQQSMITKGIPRVSSGAAAAIPKMTQFMTQWLPYAENAAKTVRAMPNNTLQDGIARAAAQITANANFVRQPYTGI